MTRVPKAGDRIGDWRLVRWLGDGRSGTVWEVVNAKNPRLRAAMKIHGGLNVKASAESFDREAEFVEGQCIRGYMPAFVERGEDDGVRYFVMELAAEFPKRLGKRRLKDVFVQLAEALQALHALGYVHCDVKPENIGLIGERVVLLDFGSVRRIGVDGLEPSRVGTWKYMAPEVRERSRLDARADVYSLAVVLQERCNAKESRVYESVILHATRNDLTERTPSVKAFLDEFKAGKDRLAKFNAIAGVTGGVVLLAGAACGVNAYRDHVKTRAEIAKRFSRRIETKDHIIAGFTYYQMGQFRLAATHLGYGLRSKDYVPEDFRGTDVKGIYEDALRRMKLSGL